MRASVLLPLVCAPCAAPQEAARVLVLGVDEACVWTDASLGALLPDWHAEAIAVQVRLPEPAASTLERQAAAWNLPATATPDEDLVLRGQRRYLARDLLGAAHAWWRAAEGGSDVDWLLALVAEPLPPAFELAFTLDPERLVALPDPDARWRALLERAHVCARELALISVGAERGTPTWEAAGARYDARLAAGAASFAELLLEFGGDSRVREVLAFHDPVQRPPFPEAASARLAFLQSAAYRDACRRLQHGVLGNITVEGLGIELVAAWAERQRTLADTLLAELERSRGGNLLVVVDADQAPFLEDELRRRGLAVLPAHPSQR